MIDKTIAHRSRIAPRDADGTRRCSGPGGDDLPELLNGYLTYPQQVALPTYPPVDVLRDDARCDGARPV